MFPLGAFQQFHSSMLAGHLGAKKYLVCYLSVFGARIYCTIADILARCVLPDKSKTIVHELPKGIFNT